MRIWRLKAIDTNSHHWEASTYRGDVLVRAESEANARRLAARAFGVATRVIPGQEVSVVPWDHPWLVSAEIVEGSPYGPDGDEEILEPA